MHRPARQDYLRALDRLTKLLLTTKKAFQHTAIVYREFITATAQEASQLQGEDLDLVHVGVELAGLRIAQAETIQICSTASRRIKPSCQGFHVVRGGGSLSGWS